MKMFNQIVVASLAMAALSSSAPAQEALNLSVRNGALMNGTQNFGFCAYGTYGMIAEGAIPGIEQAFDFDGYFDLLRARGSGQKPITGVRVWPQYHKANAYTPFNGLPATAKDTNRRKRYDLTFNAALFDRLERSVAAANAHGIAVQLCLFDGCALKKDSKRHLRWENCPYNQANNRDPRAISAAKDFFKTSGPLWDVNCAYVDLVVQRLGRYGNVIYEIMNEPDVSNTGASTEAVLGFHKVMAARLRARLQNVSGSKVICVNAGGQTLKNWALNSSDVDMLAVHLGYDDDVTMLSFRKYLEAKPVVVSNDGHKSCYGDMSSSKKAKTAANLVKRVLAADGPGDEGRLHVEFLDNDMVAGYQTPDYDPRANRADRAVLNALKTR